MTHTDELREKVEDIFRDHLPSNRVDFLVDLITTEVTAALTSFAEEIRKILPLCGHHQKRFKGCNACEVSKFYKDALNDLLTNTIGGKNE